jgi:hypothetical protein
MTAEPTPTAVEAAEALAGVLRSRGKNNSRYDIERAADLLEALALQLHGGRESMSSLPPFALHETPADDGWAWYAGIDEEFYPHGPHATRDDAIADAQQDEPEGPIFVIEARTRQMRFDAEDVITQLLDGSEDLFDYDHAQPDRVGSKEQIETGGAELQALLDGWFGKWRHTFTDPNLFAAQRNAEVIPSVAPEETAVKS